MMERFECKIHIFCRNQKNSPHSWLWQKKNKWRKKGKTTNKVICKHYSTKISVKTENNNSLN